MTLIAKDEEDVAVHATETGLDVLVADAGGYFYPDDPNLTIQWPDVLKHAPTAALVAALNMRPRCCVSDDDGTVTTLYINNKCLSGEGEP